MHNVRCTCLALTLASLLYSCAPMTEEPESISLAHQSQAASSATGSMAVARALPLLTRLTDGRVLAIGGFSSVAGILSSCELYDPTMGTWAPTGAMSVPREYHSAHLLADGRVLAVGGYTFTTKHASAEIYDPATGTWTATGSMEQPRYKQVGVTLTDGRVLVASGFNVDPNADLLTAEVFDPATGTWSATGPLLAKVKRLVRLPDGRVLGLAPGVNSQIYSPATNTWTAADPMPSGQGAQFALALADGRVLVAGGENQALRNASLYSPSTGLWTTTGSMLKGRYEPGAILLGDGTVLMAGGSDGSNILSSVERYSPDTGTWSAESALIETRTSPGVALLSGQEVLVVGGRNTASGSWAQLATSERYAVSACMPKTCQDLGAACGTLSDGCGMALDCGTCGTGLSCSTAHQCLDVTEPTAAILSPQTGTIVGATVTVRYGGWDAVGVQKVELYRDGTLVGSGTGPGPHTYSWNAQNTGELPLTRTLQAKAYDTAGNVGTSSPVTVTSIGSFARYDSGLKVPRCPVTADCNSASLLNGRANLGPETNQPNTLGGTCADGTSGTYHVQESLDSLRVYTLDGTAFAPGKTVRIEATVFATASIGRLELFSAVDATAPAWTWITTLTTSGSSGTRVLTTDFTLPSGGLQAIRGRFYPSSFDSTPLACATSFYVDHDDLVFGVQEGPDVTAPTTTITSPAEGATLTSSVTVSASASDAIGVTRVEFYLDGSTLLGTDSVPPFAVTWNAKTAAEGSHTLTSRAYDAAGNVSTSAPVSVNVVRDVTAPVVTFDAPSNGATLSGTTTLQVTASDNFGVTQVDFYAGSKWLGNTYMPPYSLFWSTGGEANGAYVLTATARDAAGNTSSATINVIVSNDTTAPTVALTTPTAGATISGTVTLQASASDNVAVSRVDFYDGTRLIASKTTAPYALAWNTTSVADGLHSLTAKAYDAAGNAATSSAVTVTVRNVVVGSTAIYDSAYRTPRCASLGSSCDSGTLLNGRAGLGPESNAPNTLGSSCADGYGGTYHVDESLDRLRISTLDGTSLAPGKTVRIEATVYAWSGFSDMLDLYYAANANSPSWTFIGTLTAPAGGVQVLSTTYTLPVGSIQAIRGNFRYSGSASPCSTGGFDDRDDLVFATQ
ncbi:Ig-like domain-containing protein [Hyalangium versicolor]|uniref:Ig-like domain-containing protein n=1 Tax=Hyalangium versicolor TaxID=2861190 RepID=UPI001CC97F81|nr:Ig-like domain-containing protein [Hyalangium versicolor]